MEEISILGRLAKVAGEKTGYVEMVIGDNKLSPTIVQMAKEDAKKLGEYLINMSKR